MPRASASRCTGARFTAFVGAFHHAFANHDRDAAVALFYWRGVTPADRTRIMTLLDRDLTLELLGVRLIAPGDTPERFEVDGVPMRKNLPVAARLLARFAASDGNPRYSLHDLGLDDGVVYIVLAAPDRAWTSRPQDEPVAADLCPPRPTRPLKDTGSVSASSDCGLSTPCRSRCIDVKFSV